MREWTASVVFSSKSWASTARYRGPVDLEGLRAFHSALQFACGGESHDEAWAGSVPGVAFLGGHLEGPQNWCSAEKRGNTAARFSELEWGSLGRRFRSWRSSPYWPVRGSRFGAAGCCTVLPSPAGPEGAGRWCLAWRSPQALDHQIDPSRAASA